MRRGTTHSKNHIQRLWHLAIDTPTRRRRNALGRAQKRAREQLQRHGFHRKRRCTMLDYASRILLRDPLEQRQALFANVIYNDLLHWELNVCDYTFAAIVGVMTPAMKLECDANTLQLPMFRKPDGGPIRRFKMVSENTYLTTARRLSLTFIWVHALGTRALMLPANCRTPALLALSSLQTIILACHGRRSYSVPEWTKLLVESAMVLFSCLQHLMEHDREGDNFTPMARSVLNIPSHMWTPHVESTCDAHMRTPHVIPTCDVAGVTAHMRTRKPIPMVMVVTGRNCGARDKSSYH